MRIKDENKISRQKNKAENREKQLIDHHDEQSTLISYLPTEVEREMVKI